MAVAAGRYASELPLEVWRCDSRTAAYDRLMITHQVRGQIAAVPVEVGHAGTRDVVVVALPASAVEANLFPRLEVSLGEEEVPDCSDWKVKGRYFLTVSHLSFLL